ncbi:MAG: iron-containing alcohol dehydrogenase [Lachnospiraceae bacterium]|nr:iron-containing alcohol dehydrogenase [Lachnospiraceae bacterium]
MSEKKLYMPTKVICGKNCIVNNSAIVAAYGSKALIVTGKHSSKVNGSLKDLEEALKKEGRNYIIFDDIEENPSVETVMKARDYGIENGADYVIGLGGGSPLDASKAIAMMMKNPHKDRDILYKNEECANLPVVAIPTTAGTGSEVTPYAILTIHEERTKRSISHRIFPQLALLDIRYLATQSYNGIVNTCTDTLAHLVESYLNTNADDYNRIYSSAGLSTFGNYKDALKTNEFDDEAYENMMKASMLGGMAIAHTQTSLPHGLSYMVTYETGEAHGRACGRFLGEFVKMYEKEDKETVQTVMNLLGFESTDKFDDYLKDLLKFKPLPEGMYERNWEALKCNKAKLKNYPFSLS